LDLISLQNSIYYATIHIDAGRKGLATSGKEQEGRISYENGIADAMTVFQEVQSSADPQTMILIELTFLRQELQFCDEADTITRNSLAQAIQSFDCLRRVRSTLSQIPYINNNR